MSDEVLANISTGQLREKANAWLHYHKLSLHAQAVIARAEARMQRDVIGSELESLGFTPGFCNDGTFILIVL